MAPTCVGRTGVAPTCVGRTGVVPTCVGRTGVVPTCVVPAGSLVGVARRSACGVAGGVPVRRPDVGERSISCLVVVGHCAGGRRCAGCGSWLCHGFAACHATSGLAAMDGSAALPLASWGVARAWSVLGNDAVRLPALSAAKELPKGSDWAGSQRLAATAASFAWLWRRWRGLAGFVLRVVAVRQGVGRCRGAVAVPWRTVGMALSPAVRAFRVDPLRRPCVRVARAVRRRGGGARGCGFPGRGSRCGASRREARRLCRLAARVGQGDRIGWRGGAQDQAVAAVAGGMCDGGGCRKHGDARRDRGASRAERCSSGRRSAGRSGESTATHSADTTFDSRSSRSGGCGRSERRCRFAGAAGSRCSRCRGGTVSPRRRSALRSSAETGSAPRSAPSAPSPPRFDRVPRRPSGTAARRRRAVRWVPECALPTTRPLRPPGC